MAGYKYHWKCPKCGTKLVLKMRTTITKRKCPHCGFLVTPEEIDRQQLPSTIGCLAILVFIVIAFIMFSFSTQKQNQNENTNSNTGITNSPSKP